MAAPLVRHWPDYVQSDSIIRYLPVDSCSRERRLRVRDAKFAMERVRKAPASSRTDSPTGGDRPERRPRGAPRCPCANATNVYVEWTIIGKRTAAVHSKHRELL